MSAINQLREDLAHTETAQFVTTMLRDISATKLQSIRAAYEANEKYFTELHELTALLQNYAVAKKIIVSKQTKKRVIIAITSNRRFYGTLNNDVITQTQTVIARGAVDDCIVIGQTGQSIIQRIPTQLETKFISFKKDEPTPEEIFTIVQSIAMYEEVYVVHPTYVNAFEQTAKITDVTHVPKSKVDTQRDVLEYLFEPDIPAMLDFFTTQIRLVLFDRIVLETRLALTGARLMKMQRARERTEEMLVTQRRVIHKEISTIQSMRLLETFSGFNTKHII